MIVRAVGLDLSLAATGYAYDEEAAVFRTSARGVVRLALIWSKIADLIVDADVVVIEDYAYSRADAHAHELGELGGVVRLGLWSAKVPFVVVNPTTLKRYALGKGGGKGTGKLDMALAAQRRLGYSSAAADDNEVDALWLRMMALDHYGDERAVRMPAEHRAALAKVPWPELAAVGAA